MRKNPKSTRKAGRPPFKPTTVMRRKVSAAAGGGMAHDEIAAAFGVSRNTLEKYFGQELGRVAFQRRVDVLDAHYRAAMRGNVSAQKAYLARQPHNPVPPPPGELLPEGKKAQANAAAVGAEQGTGWEALLPTGTVQ